jgi:hypothetical protein
MQTKSKKPMTAGQAITFRTHDEVFVEVFNRVLETTRLSRSQLLALAASAGILPAAQQLADQEADKKAQLDEFLRKCAPERAASLGPSGRTHAKDRGVTPSRGTGGTAGPAAGIADSVLPEVVAAARKPRKP